MKTILPMFSRVRLPALILLVTLVLVPAVAYAQGSGFLPCNPLKGVDCKLSHLFDLLVGIYNFLLGLAAFVAMLMLVWGAIQILIAWLGESPERSYEDGKNTIRRALFGLFLIAAAYMIVNLIVSALGGDLEDIIEGIRTS